MNKVLTQALMSGMMESKLAAAVGDHQWAKRATRESRDVLLREAAKVGLSAKEVERYLALKEDKLEHALAAFGALYAISGMAEAKAVYEAGVDDLHEWAVAAHAAQTKLGVVDPSGEAGLFQRITKLRNPAWAEQFKHKAQLDAEGVAAITEAVAVTTLGYPALAGVDQAQLRLNLAQVALNNQLRDALTELSVAGSALGFARTARALVAYLGAVASNCDFGSQCHALTGGGIFYINKPDRALAFNQLRKVLEYAIAHDGVDGFDYEAEQARADALEATPEPAMSPLDELIATGDRSRVEAYLKETASA